MGQNWKKSQSLEIVKILCWILRSDSGKMMIRDRKIESDRACPYWLVWTGHERLYHNSNINDTNRVLQGYIQNHESGAAGLAKLPSRLLFWVCHTLQRTHNKSSIRFLPIALKMGHAANYTWTYDISFFFKERVFKHHKQGSYCKHKQQRLSSDARPENAL